MHLSVVYQSLGHSWWFYFHKVHHSLPISIGSLFYDNVWLFYFHCNAILCFCSVFGYTSGWENTLGISVQHSSQLQLLTAQQRPTSTATRRDLKSPLSSSPEIYTIQGNSHGSPCYLPFLYDGQWFHSCTSIGREDGHLWCATTYNYGRDDRWGFCPVKSELQLYFSFWLHWKQKLRASPQSPHTHCYLSLPSHLAWFPSSHQALAVRHSGILTHWQTAVTSLTSRLRSHGARLGSVASSRGQTFWASPSCMSRPTSMVNSINTYSRWIDVVSHWNIIHLFFWQFNNDKTHPHLLEVGYLLTTW